MTRALIFLLVCAATFGTFFLCYAVVAGIQYALAAEDEHYRRLAPEPVDREPWEPTAPLWPNSATPIYDALAAERLRAELDDDDALYRWMEATQ